MGILMNAYELEKIKQKIQQDGSQVKALWDGLYERTIENTRQNGLVQHGDTQEWWHLIWKRLSDATFVQAVQPFEGLKEWIREVVLDVCRKSSDEWIGPWFRHRGNPPQGQLETSHIGLAVATVIDLCPEIFSHDELKEIKESLKNKCQEPCRVYVENILKQCSGISNWYMVLLNGFGTTAVILNDLEAIHKAIEYYNTAAALYNKDSYGESLQYSNYASIHLSHLYEVLVRYDAKLEERLDMGCYTRLVNWDVASFMYLKPLAGWGDDDYPRSINFGDSSALFRPTGDILLQIAARAKNTYPKEAGLARWLFDITYQNTKLQPTELATFGFFNTFSFQSLLLLENAAQPITPEQAGIPLTASFETGTVVVRDKWEEAKTILGIQGGYQPNNVTAHRHQDQNSFVLAHLKQRFFVDPGHCCYRLQTYRNSTMANNHNTWSFEDENGVEILQNLVKGNIFRMENPLNIRKDIKKFDDISIICSDAAGVYGEPIQTAERTWICAFPNVMFIIDRIKASRPIKVRSHFILNNRDNQLKTNVAAETKLVFRRAPAAIKFFQVSSKSDGQDNPCNLSFGWGYVHDCYHPLHNQKGQGAEGSATIYNYTSSEYKTNHTIVYAIVMEHIDKIKQWHIKSPAENVYHALPPGNIGGVSISFNEGQSVTITNHNTNHQYTV